MNRLSLDTFGSRSIDTTQESAMKPNHAKRDVLMAAAVLLLAASACVYGFIKIVPLALAHSEAGTSTSAP